MLQATRGRLSIRRLSKVAQEVAGLSGEKSSVDSETTTTNVEKLKPATNIQRPNYRNKANPGKRVQHILNEEFLNEGDRTGAGARLWDYHETARIINSLPTIAEKIDFASPYERPWVKFEETWRRDYHPTLHSPRKAWRVPSVPEYFDVLPFYQHITKTRVVWKDVDEYYEGLNPPTALFEELLADSMNGINTRFPVDNAENLAKNADAVAASTLDSAILSVAHNNPRFQDYRIAYDVQSEAFWIKAGFDFLYDVKEIGDKEVTRKKPREISKYIGDDRRHLGELAFVHRDRLSAQVRCREPLKPLFGLDDPQATMPVFPAGEEPDVKFSPKIFNLWPDSEALWQCPGYFADSGETHPHTRLAVKSLAPLLPRLQYWQDGWRRENEVEIPVDLVAAQAVVSLFTTLCAQAHTAGFTQYTDVTRPFTSQLALFDGKGFWFAVGQLNTLAFNIECDGFVNPRTNYVQINGPYQLEKGIKAVGEKGNMYEPTLSLITKMLLRD
ncbi:unnamed protein product, partial [Mesorhabditis spiculigera]